MPVNSEKLGGKIISSPVGTGVEGEADEPTSFRLTLLGNFSLQDLAGRSIDISSRKNRALLAILALAPGHSCSRERLSTLLWGDHGEEQARSSLRQSLTVLRRDIGSDRLIRAQDDLVSLSPDAISTDVQRLFQWDDQSTLSTLRSTASAWTGELLQDVSLRDASFDEWLRIERSRLRAAAGKLFSKLFELESGTQRTEVARRLVDLDPLSESAQRKLMRALADQGDKGLALKQFDVLRELLQSELGVAPAEETLALRREIAGGPTASTAAADHIATSTAVDRDFHADRPAIAVLPFDNSSADPDQLFLSDGISEDIIASLSRFRQLTVIARSSSFAFRGATTGIREIGQSLGASFVLHGSIRRAGQRLRVIAELRHISSHAALWTERFDRDIDDLFTVIDDLSAAITASTIGKIEDEVLKRLRQSKRERYAAYELMLRGRHLLHAADWPSKLQARKYFEEAIVLEPEFALAKVQLALTYLHEFFFDDSGTALDRATSIANEALVLDDSEPWCHMVLALTHLHRRRFQLAVSHAERAVALNGSDPKLIAKLALVLVDAGRPDDAIPHIRKAMRLTPLSPEDFADYLALACYGARRYAEAKDAMQMLPADTFYYHVWSSAISYRLGDQEQARKHRDDALRLAPDFSIGRFAKMEPLQYPQDLAHWTEALSASGFPD